MIGIVSVTDLLVLNECEAVIVSGQYTLVLKWLKTYSRLVCDRGAGISQRTKRPYLQFACQSSSHRKAEVVSIKSGGTASGRVSSM